MKKIIYFLVVAMLLLSTVSCKKDPVYSSSNGSTLMVVNGVVNNPAFPLLLTMNGKLNTSGMSSNSNVTNTPFGAGTFFFSTKAIIPLGILKATDSSVLTSGNYDLRDNSVYSLLVAGQAPNIETVLVKEISYPFFGQDIIPGSNDSVINIRFINLAVGTSPLNVRITGLTTNEATGLGYKGYTEFKAYPAKISNASYKFDIVEGSTVLTTYTLSVIGANRFKNVALLIRGVKNAPAGMPALGVSLVNYY